jgi:membrane protein
MPPAAHVEIGRRGEPAAPKAVSLARASILSHVTGTEIPVRSVRLAFEVLFIAYNRFVLHDAWAIASHIALSFLMSMFPFLILVTGLASFFGTGSLADEAADIILEAWPVEVAKPIANEVHSILTVRRDGILTLGLFLALYFSSSGVEALRVGLNRAYGLRETRGWWFTRLESIAFVIGGAFVMLAFALLVVLGPLVWRAALQLLPGLHPFDGLIAFLRIGVATVLIVVALVLAHKLVPAGRRDFRSVMPGVMVTLFLWIVGGLGFGWYLDNYPGAYASTYGGLATAMSALVFLYTLAAIFLFGGELNGTVIAAKRRRLNRLSDARHFDNVVTAP